MNALRSCARGILSVQRLTTANYTGKRCIARWMSPAIKEIVRRKKRAGPQPPDKRSNFLEWNHGAELYAFNEEQKQRDVGIEDPKLDIQENTELIENGQRLTEKIIKAYLCKALPRLPEEGIYALLDYLMSQEMVARASLHIGTKDLILTADHPVSEEALACTFYALVTALAQTPNVDLVHVANFVRDFLIACLADKDLTEIWCPDEPENILNEILVRENRAIAEPRLIAQTGVNSFLAAYHVAFYSNKEFLGKAFGETIDEARNAAAIEAINRMFGLGDSCKPINFHLAMDVTSDLRMENLPLTHWCRENVNKLMSQ